MITPRKLLFALLTLLTPILCQAEPSISIRALENGLWQADYQLQHPVGGLQFMRNAGFLREKNWQVKTPGYHFIRNENGQALTLKPGAEAKKHIQLVFPVDTRFINRDYELFNSFTDGSLALFTGHFYARPHGDKVPAEYSRGYLVDLAIAPPPGDKLGLKGELSEHKVRWTDTSGEGTYIYIGNTSPVTADGVTAIFDKGLPEWVAKEAQKRIPELMTFYTRHLGRHSELPPLVLFSYEPDGTEGYNYNGGTRSDLIQIRVQGSDWQHENSEAKLTLIRFFAHEAAHLWNGQAAHSAADAPPWLHEGSADAMAERAMLTLGIINADQYQRYQETALNQCLAGLSGSPLNNSTNSRVYYDCGNVLALWSELSLKEKKPTADLFDIWQRLIESYKGGDYGQDEYFHILEAMGVEKSHLDAMAHFVTNVDDQPETVLTHEFTSLGLEVTRDDQNAQQSALIAVSGAVVSALLKTDCTNGYGFYNHGDWLELAHLSGCQNSREGLRIDRIEQASITAGNFLAYHLAKAACAKNNTVALGNDREVITLSCPANLPPLSGWWTISAFESGLEQ